MVMVAVGGVALIGCSDDLEPTPTTTGIANPASEFCVAQGGTIEIVDDPSGQLGYCNLPDGTRIEEWAYYRDMNNGNQP
jgi:putative hemolysin